MLCILKHVEGVESWNNFRIMIYVGGVKGYFDLQHLWHALTYIVFDGMVGKPWVSAFQNFLRIENRLNIKKVMSKDV